MTVSLDHIGDVLHLAGVRTRDVEAGEGVEAHCEHGLLDRLVRSEVEPERDGVPRAYRPHRAAGGVEELEIGDLELTGPPSGAVLAVGLVVEVHLTQVFVDHLARRTDLHQVAVLKQRELVTQCAHGAERVRHDHDRLAALLELGELLRALPLEALVADRQHLVDEEDVGIDVDCDREAQTHVHARRVVLDRRVDELGQAGEVHDFVEAVLELLLRHPEDRAVEVHVPRPDSSGWKPAPSSNSAEILPCVEIEPRSGRRIRAMHLSKVLLPEPFSPMSPKVVPFGMSNDTPLSASNSRYRARRPRITAAFSD